MPRQGGRLSPTTNCHSLGELTMRTQPQPRRSLKRRQPIECWQGHRHHCSENGAAGQDPVGPIIKSPAVVEKEIPGRTRQCSCQRRALLLSTRQSSRATIGQTLDLAERQRFNGAAVALLLGKLLACKP